VLADRPKKTADRIGAADEQQAEKGRRVFQQEVDPLMNRRIGDEVVIIQREFLLKTAVLRVSKFTIQQRCLLRDEFLTGNPVRHQE
jgi:hypothetical protein